MTRKSFVGSNIGFASHARTSPASSERRASESAAIDSASSALGIRSSSGDELIERVGESDQVGLLARRQRLEPLAEPVDPDGWNAERRRGDDVVEMRRSDVHVRQALQALLERTP